LRRGFGHTEEKPIILGEVLAKGGFDEAPRPEEKVEKKDFLRSPEHDTRFYKDIPFDVKGGSKLILQENKQLLDVLMKAQSFSPADLANEFRTRYIRYLKALCDSDFNALTQLCEPRLSHKCQEALTNLKASGLKVRLGVSFVLSSNTSILRRRTKTRACWSTC
jgi:hypothetical protein